MNFDRDREKFARLRAAVIPLLPWLGLAATCWVVSVWQMTGMDRGVATRLGSKETAR